MSNSQTCIRVLADKEQINACQGLLEVNSQSITDLSRLLALAGNEVRLKIVFLLKEEQELCPCDLSDILGMSVPAISQHLRKLKDGDVVESRREGQTIYYALKQVQMALFEPFFKQITQASKKELV